MSADPIAGTVTVYLKDGGKMSFRFTKTHTDTVGENRLLLIMHRRDGKELWTVIPMEGIRFYEIVMSKVKEPK